jgi:hypothetical protein
MYDDFVETWWNDDTLTIKIQWTADRKQVFIHHALKNKLTPSLFKKHKEVLQGVCEELKEMGYDKLYAFSPCQSDVWKHLCKMFGFVQLPKQNELTYFVKEC